MLPPESATLLWALAWVAAWVALAPLLDPLRRGRAERWRVAHPKPVPAPYENLNEFDPAFTGRLARVQRCRTLSGLDISPDLDLLGGSTPERARRHQNLARGRICHSWMGRRWCYCVVTRPDSRLSNPVLK